ncbi:MAG: SGNH/GDSL hydrolase family protein [Pseudomonadota bacterium]
METYGDSLTAGFLADTSLKEPPELSKLSELLQELAFGFLQKDRELLKKHEANDKAWPHFLSEDLRSRGKQISEVLNLAVSGSRSGGILSQVQMSGANSNRTWAFVFVGHNDLCHVKGEQAELVQQFNNHVSEALVEWDKNHKNSMMFLIPTGPIYQLYPVLENYPWMQTAQKTFRCQDAWTKYLPYCVAFYQRYKRGELESYLKPRGDSLNVALSELANRWNIKSGNRNRYFYLDAQWPLPLHPDYFALDCYHIAEEGQRIFARNIFDAIVDHLPQEF